MILHYVNRLRLNHYAIMNSNKKKNDNNDIKGNQAKTTRIC